MRKIVSASARLVLVGVVAIVSAGAGHQTALADPVSAGGSTAGCFNCGSTWPFASTSSLLGPPYDSADFEVLTSVGSPSVPPNLINRGAFQFQIDTSHISPGNERITRKIEKPAAMLPESIALLLVGAGVIGIAANLRKRRRAHQPSNP